MMRLVVALTSLILLTPLAAAETKRGGAGKIEVRLRGFESEAGVAVCALFTRDAWLQPGKGQPRKVTIRDHRATCEFANVPHGSYAIAAFHDEDGDGEFDKRLGIPLERYCFSNRAAPRRLRPPTFDDAKFEHGGPKTEQLCELR
ncbi:MAG TPA: DUF2141 domain-containing protein [Polyangiaceae bacterium]|nr:DUF2141 domain-containing protein [Polyangiaceae bacterium]